ncbi:MAG: alpha/beta fold hydrolase [Pyrinomonadaceae bacterium]|nr:alpha/beta fold hydrolase [Pyrinomonadaceae bacterium]
MNEPTYEGDFTLDEPFKLESGEILPSIKQRFTIYGNLNERRDNAVLVFHALTGSARIHEWWRDVVGKSLNRNDVCLICANHIGSCYGSTSSSEIQTLITAKDVVNAQIELLQHLRIEKLYAAIGGSVGGMLALQLAVDFPNLAEKIIAIGACELPAMSLALNHLQREALKIENGVSLARKIAMITYKSAEFFDARHARKSNRNGENPRDNVVSRYDVAGYLDYQGESFVKRFDVQTYNLISKMMDLFELSDDDISKIKSQICLIGISSDWLFPLSDVRKLSERLKTNLIDTTFIEMNSIDGHDAFLTDTNLMNEILSDTL